MTRAAEVAAVGVGLCLVAGAVGVPALYIPGLALVLLAAGAWSWVRCASAHARVTRHPLSLITEEGQRLTLEVRIDRSRPFARSGEFAPVAGAAFSTLRSRTRRVLEVNASARRRGAQLLAPSLVRFRDPFGICTRDVASEATELLVLPRLERIAPADLSRITGGRASGALPGDSWGEIDGLRVACADTRASRIHWASVARTGTLMERRLAPEPDAVPLIVLDGHEPADPRSLDMAVRAAGSLALAFARSGGCSLLLPAEQRPHRLDAQLRGWRRAHSRLALARPGAVAWAQCARASLVVLVTASATPRPRGMGHSRIEYVVSPFPRAERRILLEVAGCAVQAADRRRAVRAA